MPTVFSPTARFHHLSILIAISLKIASRSHSQSSHPEIQLQSTRHTQLTYETYNKQYL